MRKALLRLVRRWKAEQSEGPGSQTTTMRQRPGKASPFGPSMSLRGMLRRRRRGACWRRTIRASGRGVKRLRVAPASCRRLRNAGWEPAAHDSVSSRDTTFRRRFMEGLMQDFPLTIHHIVRRMATLFARKEVVTKTADGLHRISYGELAPRIRRAAAALRRLGVREGDRVATLAWNNHRHFELYYAIPCMGAVLHTLNLRLSPDQLAFI